MARPGWPERNRAARSFRQLRRFHHVINSDKVFGTHRFRNRTRSARRRMQAIQRMTIRQRREQQTATYRELIGIAEEVIESARAALRQTRKARSKGMITDLAIAETRKEIEHFCGLGDRVIDQSRRRVLNGVSTPIQKSPNVPK